MIYKVEYSGVAIVEADNPEEAEEKVFEGLAEYDTTSMDSIKELNDCQFDIIDALYLSEL